MRVGLVQMNVYLGKYEDNVRRMLQSLGQLAEADCDLVVLPELWDVGFDYDSFGKYQDLGKQTLKILQQAAKEYQLNIHGGSVLVSEQDKFYNRTYLINNAGQVVANYNKVHLFGLMDEPAFMTAGDQIVLAEVNNVKLGLAICYDLRFPELFRALAKGGAQVICVPGQWPSARIEHWRTLLKARAIENQLFIVGVNRVGLTGTTQFGGYSLVVDPWGEVLVEAELKEDILTCELLMEKVEEVRSKMSCWTDRRLDLYS